MMVSASILRSPHRTLRSGRVFFCVFLFSCTCLLTCDKVPTVPLSNTDPADTLKVDPHDKPVPHDSVKAPVAVFVSPHDGDTVLDTLQTLVKIIGWDSGMVFTASFFDPSDTSTYAAYYKEFSKKEPVAVVKDTAFFEFYRDIQLEKAQRRIVARVLRQRRRLDSVWLVIPRDTLFSTYKDSLYSSITDTVVQESLTVYVRPLVLSVENWNHGDVYKIVEDSSGIVWLLTANGLCYFDGSHFGYAYDLIPGLSGIHSRKIAVDPAGNLWVDSIGSWTTNGCPTKLIVWNGGRRIATYPFPLLYDCDGDIGFDREGNFLAVPPDGYTDFVHFEGDTMVRKPIDRCNNQNNVYGVRRSRFLFDHQNRLWITTSGGVALMSGADCNLFNTSNTDWPGAEANDIAVGPDGVVYVQFSTHIASYNGTWHTEITKSNGEYEGLDVDAEGNLWVLQYFTGPIVIKIRNGKVLRGYGENDTYSGDVHVCRDGTVVAGGAGAILFIREKGFLPNAHL